MAFREPPVRVLAELLRGVSRVDPRSFVESGSLLSLVPLRFFLGVECFAVFFAIGTPVTHVVAHRGLVQFASPGIFLTRDPPLLDHLSALPARSTTHYLGYFEDVFLFLGRSATTPKSQGLLAATPILPEVGLSQEPSEPRRSPIR